LTEGKAAPPFAPNADDCVQARGDDVAGEVRAASSPTPIWSDLVGRSSDRIEINRRPGEGALAEIILPARITKQAS
jgi:hypothetical protein